MVSKLLRRYSPIIGGQPDIGVTAASIRRWVKQYSDHGEDAFPAKGNLKPEDAELKEMKKKLRDLEEENAILKKAMAIFSRDAK